MFKKLSITVATGLGLVIASAALSPAQAKWVEGSCSVFDATVDVAGEDVEATNCGNFSGNDSQVGFIDYLNGDKAWSGLGGYDTGDADDADFAAAVDALDGDLVSFWQNR